VASTFDHGGVLLHQGIGLDAFNALSEHRAVHATYECCNSFIMARDLARGRAYVSHDALFRRADSLLFALSESTVDQILDACPDVGRRPRSEKSQAEQCAIWCDQPEVMEQLAQAAKRYLAHFGFGFVMFVNGYDAQDVLATMTDRLLNDFETERKVVRNELARINRTRLERMLGPEGGYDNW
jgi:2-oxo-4-hydroxy-4-carboxy-5-ureidoimidazoline decarboxylase